MALEPNTTVSHYKILSSIGKGGMGEVYLAEDSTLGRKVAIKFISEDFKNDKDKLDRFIQEAKAASALNHPNIITVYEIGSADGTDFIATEYIDGKDLNRLMAESPVALNDALDIAIQAASALRAAHEAGIVHRDIKSDNVMVRGDGIVKILDFGLAKLTQSPDAATSDPEGETIAKVVTQPGIVMGTPNYMSPEQVRGRGVDHRTDIFSLGVLLFEMIARVRPFEGDTTSDVMAAVLTRTPKRLGEFGVRAPEELEQIVARALEKDAAKRYQTADDLHRDLTELKQELQIRERLQTTSPPENQPTQTFDRRETIETGSFSSVAVLPFTNMSADEENEYFCDGLAEELIGTLSKISELKVAARSTSFLFKGQKKSAAEIGEALGVKAILDGSVRRSGERMRITVQLVNAADGYQIWSERFDREMKDIFEIQDEIALSVADALKLQLLGEEREAVLQRYTNNAEAYQLYLRGRFFFFKRTPEGFRTAIDYFERAIEIDPDYAIAYSGLADSWVFLGFYEVVEPAVAEAALTPLVDKALQLDGSLAETLVSSAIKKALYEWDFDGSLEQYRKAIENNPRYAFAHHLASTTLALLGKGDEAVKHESRACELEPFTAIFSAAVAWWYYLYDKPDESIDQALKTIEIAPNHFFAHWVLGLSYARQGRYPEALASLSNARSLTNGSQHIVAEIGRVYAMAGKKDESLRILADLDRAASEGYVSAVNFARLNAGLRNRDKVLDYIEKGVAERAIKLPFTLVDPILDDYWSEPRFRAAAAKVGVKPSYPLSTVTDRSLEAPTVVIRQDTGDESAARSAFPIKWAIAAILAVAAIAFGYLGFGYFFGDGGKTISSIAVMPFVNDSATADSEYLSDGIVESLIYRLSQIDSLKVSPSSSVIRFKEKQADPIGAGKELGVEAVMTGRIAQRGEDLIISVELVDVRNSKTLWGERYNRKKSELLATQQEITDTIIQKLQVKLAGEDEEGLRKVYTSNSEAYELYLKGRFHYDKRTKADIEKGIDYYDQALVLDPNFALAYVGIANAYGVMPSYGYISPKEAGPKAMAAARKALEIDPNLADAHAAVAYVAAALFWDWETAGREFGIALEMDPNNAVTRVRYGYNYLLPMARTKEAVAEIKRALELEPLSIPIGAMLADAYQEDGQIDKALEQIRVTDNLEPGHPTSAYWYMSIYASKGMCADALRLANARLAKTPNDQDTLSIAGYCYAKAGNREKAEAVIAKFKELSKTQFILNSYVAQIYDALNEKDKAFAALEKAVEERDFFIPTMRTNPIFSDLRGERRFGEILKRAGLPGTD